MNTSPPPYSAPAFAVVGRVNKGKSSIIATLTENESVKISRRPGTTTEVVEYSVSIDDRELFKVIDTPGFEDAARMLHWLDERAHGAAHRRERLLEFLDHFEGTSDFVEERRLLTPILRGAAVLYVADGTRPYRIAYEAEMDILRRTGAPGIALINRIGDGDYIDEWRNALKQYFDLVRPFDAHDATFQERLQLLADIGTLKPEWRQPLGEAVEALRIDRSRRLEKAAEIIAKLLIKVETLQLSDTARDERPTQEEKRALERRFHEKIRALEHETHRRLDALYRHTRFQEALSELAIEEVAGEDLFAEDTWRAMGLTPQTELGLYTATGAGIGLAADAAVGGLSGGGGAVLGGLAGAGIGALRIGSRFAKAGTPGGLWRALGSSLSGETARRITIGPHPSLNLPFILMNRAFARLDLVRNWAHARSEIPAMHDVAIGDLRETLSLIEQKKLARNFARLRKSAPDPPFDVREETYELIEEIVLRTLAVDS